MNLPLKLALAIFCVIALSACSSPTPTSIPTSVPTATIAPTPTFTPSPTPTTIPTATPTPQPSPTATTIPVTPTSTALALPTGTPVSMWKDVPIMPQAIAGAEVRDGYSYTIKVAAKQIEDFYRTEMARAGWEIFAAGTREGAPVLLIFRKNKAISSVGIFEQQDVILVIINHN